MEEIITNLITETRKLGFEVLDQTCSAYTNPANHKQLFSGIRIRNHLNLDITQIPYYRASCPIHDYIMIYFDLTYESTKEYQYIRMSYPHYRIVFTIENNQLISLMIQKYE